MSDFEVHQEWSHRQADAIDRLRTETALELRKYARRVREVGVDYVKAQFALNHDSDPYSVAMEAKALASQGMFIDEPRGVISAPSRSTK